ncbi:MAG: DUF1292 domain-containing protein [Clostridia bacterium]|nr:DUF1292 domain-containing protein [Clostridia bacterium]
MEENFEGEELDNIVVLNDENGNEVKFEFLDLVELDDEEYVVLLPIVEEGEEDDGEVVILKLEDNDDEDSEEESYVSVDDEEVLNRVFEIFKEKFKDEFDFLDEE